MNPESTQMPPASNDETKTTPPTAMTPETTQTQTDSGNNTPNSKKKIFRILGVIVVAIIILPFIFGLYAVGPVEFPCTYQQVQGKKALNNLENDVQGLTVMSESPTKITSSTSLDCIDGSLNDPMSVKATFNLTSPVSLSEAESAVIANEQFNKSEQQDYKAVTNLGARQDDPRMREVRISALEKTYSSNGSNKYKVIYNFHSTVACTAPTPPESKLDDSACRSKTTIVAFGLNKQPVKTITITRTVIPSKE